MDIPRFTVYLPSHNYGKYLEEAVESVLRQSTDSWELLIINDNSSDNTREIMSLYQGDPRIRLFHAAGLGLHGVCNLALKEARGEYIIRLDGDDRFDENILLVLGNALDTNSHAAMVFPDYYLIDEFGEIFAHEQHNKIYEANHVNDMPPHGACTLIRTSVLREIGGYRSDMRAQDGYYIWSRIVKNYRCINVNLPLFYYRRHGQNLTNKSYKIFEARRQIKKETVVSYLGDYQPFIAVIPCRTHYDFLPDLWNERINGITLLENTINTCLKSPLFDHIVVTCDNEDVKATLERYDDPRLHFIKRTRQETLRSYGIVPTLDKIAGTLDPERKGITVLSYNQSPFVTTATLEEAIFTLVMNDADSSCGAEEIDRPIYRRSSHGLEQLNSSTKMSNDFQKIYAEARTVIATRNRQLSSGSLGGSRMVHFLVSSDECFFINSPQTLKIARIMFADEEKWQICSSPDHPLQTRNNDTNQQLDSILAKTLI